MDLVGSEEVLQALLKCRVLGADLLNIYVEHVSFVGIFCGLVPEERRLANPFSSRIPSPYFP